MTVDNTSEKPTIFGFSEVLSTLAGHFGGIRKCVSHICAAWQWITLSDSFYIGIMEDLKIF
jgi:hypothetical protein